MAKYLKKGNPKFDVVLVEPHAMFMSCPLSNLWQCAVGPRALSGNVLLTDRAAGMAVPARCD